MTFKTLLGKRRRIKKPINYLINWEEGSRSKLQGKVKNFLKVFWDGDVVFEEFPVVGSRLTLDFYNATKNIAIEVQGKLLGIVNSWMGRSGMSSGISYK